MRWLEQIVRQYEHRMWAEEPNRRVLPFAWGLEHIGGAADDPDPRAYLERFVSDAIAHSDDWFAITPAEDYSLDGDLLTFTSQIRSPWPENNRVHGQYFQAKNTGPAVVVLPQWNSRWEQQQDVCRFLNRLGITAIKMSLPYHDRRAIPGHPRGDHLVGPNIGLTLQANRQAVLDARRTLLWLAERGYDRLGILGTSVGSSIGFVTLAHEPLLRAGAFLHVSTYFGTVVSTGMTTMNVWESLQSKLSHDELRHFWSPISPYPYLPRLHGSRKKILALMGTYDPTFWPEFSHEFVAAGGGDGLQLESTRLPCGHYSLAAAPFKYIAGYRFGTFLFQSLA
jgi:hypothetical protein